MKTYVLIVSKKFPCTHPKKGCPTEFICKILHAINHSGSDLYQICQNECDKSCHRRLLTPKIHTIRSNYYFWKKRIDNVNKGNAVLSIRYWNYKPYRSKQVEICQLDSTSGIGIEKLEDPSNFVFAPINGKWINWETIAKNDGLSFDDFCEWFKARSNNPMAIIHFTKFRYARK